MAGDTVYLPQQRTNRGVAGWKVKPKSNIKVVDADQIPSDPERVITTSETPARSHHRRRG